MSWRCGKARRVCLIRPSTVYLDLHRPILDAVKSPLRPQQPTRVLQAQGPHLSWDHLAAPLDLGKNFGLVGVHPVFSPKNATCVFRNQGPSLRRTCLNWHPSTRMTQAFGLFGSMCSSLNGFNYYKRVTFFICSHARSLSGIRIISGTQAIDQEGLA